MKLGAYGSDDGLNISNGKGVAMLSSEIICEYLQDQNYNIQYWGEHIMLQGISSLESPKEHTISWIKSGRAHMITDILYADKMLFVINKDDQYSHFENHHVITCNNPKEIFFEIVEKFFLQVKAANICKDSIICSNKIGKNVSIGHHCFIGEDVIIGDHVVIKNNVSIECPAFIGEKSIIHSGAILGGDGFGYYKNKEGIHKKVPHLGGIVIGRNVEIGANSCIDRGTIDNTIIGDHAKIDNLCHIAHNVKIGANTLVIALSVLGGSSVLEDNSYIAPGVTVRNQVRIGENTVVGMGSVVTKNIGADKIVMGVPAREV